MKYLNIKNKGMRILYSIFFVTLLCSFSGLKAQQDTMKVSLQKALETALQNNLQIKQAQFQAAVTDENLKQSKYELLPSLSASADFGRDFGLQFNQNSGRFLNQAVSSSNAFLQSNLILSQGGTRISQIAQNKYLLLSDKSNIEKVKTDLSLTVITTFLEAIKNRDLVTASRQQLDLSNLQVNVAQKNFDVGNNTLADLSQAKAQSGTNELALTNALNAYDLSILNLKQLMEMNPAISIALETPLLPDVKNVKTDYDAVQVYTTAVENYAEVKTAQYSTESFKKGIKVTKGQLYPQFSVGARLGDRYSSALLDTNRIPIPFREQVKNNYNQFFGFTLSIPIFNNYRSRAAYNISKIRFENAKATEQLTKNNFNKVINQALLDLRSADKRYYSTQIAFTSSGDAFRVIKQRYDVGLANSIDLTTAQTNFNKAEFDFIQAKYDLIFRSKVIDFYLGKPLTL